jgi:hypothetical protein
MTTSVTIKHNGPGHHDVIVEVVADGSGAVLREQRIKLDASVELFVYRGQSIRVAECIEPNS